MEAIETSNEYNSEPVRYCAKCYSLKVKYEEALDGDYCADCGSTDILESPIEEWEEKYSKRYGHKFTVKEEDPNKTYLFKLSPKELMYKVSDNPKWKEIISKIYPHFPGGYSKADSIILFFDTLIKQNKLGELKLLLFKYFKH